jgi:hypothetical protein
MKTVVMLAAAGVAVGLGGCASNEARVVTPATQAEQAALIDQVKGLAGTWKGDSPHGEGTVTFTVSSNGSSVREIMFPGQPHEMTNMYHMDGGTLVMTHYCAGGNQPRMRASAGKAGEIDMRYDGVTNLQPDTDHFMGGMKLVIVDTDHIREEWKMVKDGKVADGPVFELTRVK